MGIFDRMGRVISANVNGLLDKATDDRKLLELNLDEMDEQLKRGRQDVVSAVATVKQLAKKEDELAAEAEKWDKRAELAVKSGDEALAREALKQKKRVVTERASAQRARTEQQAIALRMREELDRMDTKLKELRMKKGTIAARADISRSGPGGETLGARGGSNAFHEFKRMEEKIEGREAETSAMNEVEEALGGGTRGEDLEAKFRDLERSLGGPVGGAPGSPDVEEELAAIKKRIRV